MRAMPSLRNADSGHAGAAACLRLLVIALLIACGLSAAAPPALAQSLDAARSSGMVGERYDGYAVARPSATAAVRSMVASVNSKRSQIYAQRARQQNISPSQVGRLYAGQIFAKAPKGTWFLSQSGAWTRK